MYILMVGLTLTSCEEVTKLLIKQKEEPKAVADYSKYTQEDSTHMFFKNVPINGPLEMFVKRMEQQGFKNYGSDNSENILIDPEDSADDGTAVLYGDFADYKDCILHVQTLDSKDVVAKINVAFPVREEWDDLRYEQRHTSQGSQLGLKLRLENGVLEHIARGCGGDVRKSINTVELCILSADNDGEKLTVNLDNVKLLTQRSNMRYDRAGDEHYDILSALQKSIRGSDENAALHYAARLIEAGDIISLCRRLLVIASEDIGLAYPMAAVVTKSCVDSALQLGLPEARIPLAEAVVLLATAPKSNSAESAIDAALADVRNGDFGDYPRHLQNKHFDGEGAVIKGQHYLYPHDYPNHWVKQQYLPDKLVGRTYYQYGENKTEQMAKAYWEKIKK